MSLKEKKEQDKVLKASIRQKDIEKKEALISLVMNYPEIWDKSNEGYRDRILQGVKWKEIADIMKMSIKDVKNMWKYLKDQFRTNFHAVSHKKSGQEYVEESDINLVKWPFFRQLMFLKDVVTRRDTVSNIEEHPPNDEEQDGEAANQIFSEIGCEVRIVEEEDIRENYEVENNQTSQPSTSRNTPPVHEPHKGRETSINATNNITNEHSSAQNNTNPSMTRASTVKPKTRRKRIPDEGDDALKSINEDISKVDQLLAASIAHDCQTNVEGRPQRFCKYLADVLCEVHKDLQMDCETELMGVVRNYVEKSKELVREPPRS